MTVDANFYRSLVSKFPSGVTVVMARNQYGEPHGATVSAFSSMSLDPPIVVVSLMTKGYLASIMRGCATFSVNILRDDQAPVARQFAAPEQYPGQRFQNIETRSCDISDDGGAPVLCDSLATILCRSNGAVVIGDHTLFIGIVVGGRAREGSPLIHGLGSFARMEAL